MGLLDNYTGVGMSPRPKWEHQMVINLWHGFTFKELREQGLFMLTEATLTKDWGGLAPDLVIFNKDYIPLSIIEITTHKECNSIKQKCYELIERFPKAEYFVYDYEKRILYMYDIEEDEWVSSIDHDLMSRYLERPLLEYLIL